MKHPFRSHRFEVVERVPTSHKYHKTLYQIERLQCSMCDHRAVSYCHRAPRSWKHGGPPGVVSEEEYWKHYPDPKYWMIWRSWYESGREPVDY